MFLKAYITCVALIAPALATPFKRDVAISIDLQAPSTSSTQLEKSSPDLELVATVTNNGAEEVKILKYGTILDDKLPTKSFVVTKDGNPVAFTGIKLSVSLNDVDDTAFAVLAAGQSVTVSHKGESILIQLRLHVHHLSPSVAALYDFATAGAGKFTFAPIANFLVDDSAVKEKSSEANFFKVQAASVNSVEVEFQGEVKREMITLDARANNICTTASKKTFIDASYTEAKTLASTASSYISSKGASDTLYKAYFGATATSKVTTILNAVANENSASRTLSCVDSYNACSSGVIAYTLIATTNIYFCSIFFNEVATSNLCSGTTVASRNVRGGTTLHELTHAVGNTDDVTYGCSADQALSNANKVLNADNFNCFTTQVYTNTEC